MAVFKHFTCAHPWCFAVMRWRLKKDQELMLIFASQWQAATPRKHLAFSFIWKWWIRALIMRGRALTSEGCFPKRCSRSTAIGLGKIPSNSGRNSVRNSIGRPSLIFPGRPTIFVMSGACLKVNRFGEEGFILWFPRCGFFGISNLLGIGGIK